jgi:hypothetical protein
MISVYVMCVGGLVLDYKFSIPSLYFSRGLSLNGLGLVHVVHVLTA